MIAQVYAFPLAAKGLGDDMRELQVKVGEELSAFWAEVVMSYCRQDAL